MLSKNKSSHGIDIEDELWHLRTAAIDLKALKAEMDIERNETASLEALAPEIQKNYNLNI